MKTYGVTANNGTRVEVDADFYQTSSGGWLHFIQRVVALQPGPGAIEVPGPQFKVASFFQPSFVVVVTKKEEPDETDGT